MRPSDLTETLLRTIKVRRPMIVWGPPGIGKSQIIHLVCAMLKMRMIDIRAVLLDPVDLRGVPHVKDGKTFWCPPAFLPSAADGPCVILLDELPQATTLVQASLLQLMLDRAIGEYRLPDDVVILAAGNRQEDRAGANRLITPMRNRLVHVDLEVDYKDWQDWAATKNIAPEVRSFIKTMPDQLHQFDPVSKENAFPTPRTWEFVSDLLPTLKGSPCLSQVVAGCVGTGAASQFVGHMIHYAKIPDIDLIIKDPKNAPLPDDAPSVLWSLCMALVSRVARDPKNIKAISAITEYGARMNPEYTTLLMKDLGRINAATIATPAAKVWGHDNRDLLIAASSK